MRWSMVVLILWVSMSGGVEAASMKEVDSVRETIHAWSRAWENKNFDAYMSCYSLAFRSGELDYDGWYAKQKERFQNMKDIFILISDIWVFLEGDHAEARFFQRCRSQSGTDVGEMKISLARSAGEWKILSEEWKPLESAPLFFDEREAVPTPRHSRQEHKDIGHEGIGTIANGSFSELGEVRSIEFQIGGEKENVLIQLSSFSIPEFFTLNGNKPRIVVDIGNVSTWKGMPKMAVNGQHIRQIRTYLHKDTGTLRIVLDLELNKDYSVEQLFDMTQNRYSISVGETGY